MLVFMFFLLPKFRDKLKRREGGLYKASPLLKRHLFYFLILSGVEVFLFCKVPKPTSVILSPLFKTSPTVSVKASNPDSHRRDASVCVPLPRVTFLTCGTKLRFRELHSLFLSANAFINYLRCILRKFALFIFLFGYSFTDGFKNAFFEFNIFIFCDWYSD